MCCGQPKKIDMTKNRNYKKSVSIPEETKLEIVKQLDILARTILAPSRSAVTILFKVFNEYINDFPNDTTCSQCRTVIYNFFKGAKKQWQKDRLI